MNTPCIEGPVVFNFTIGSMKKRCNHVFWNYKVGRPKLKGGIKMALEATCTNEEKVPISLKPVTPAGNPIVVEALNIAVQSGEGTFEIVDDANFFVVSGPTPGDTVYIVTADADLGEGVQNISDVITLHVEGAKAQSLGLGVGTPVLK